MNMEDMLSPASDADKAALIGDEYVSQVRAYGALGYTPQRICSLLELRGKERLALSVRIGLPGDIYYDAYHNGLATGEYNIDTELMKMAESGDIDAVHMLEERRNQRIELDLRKQLFGV